MNAYLRVAIVAIVASCGLDTAEAGQQQSTYHKPMAPIGPTSDAQCQALEAEWSSVCEQISAAHQQCLDANTDPAIKRAGACDKAPCLALHIENESCGGAERTSAVSACWTAVRAHQDREAEFKAAQQAALRAEQEAERQRKARIAAETDKSRMEADAARRRKEEYLHKTPRTGAIRSGLDGGQASLVADLRTDAERNAARRSVPLPVTAGTPPPTPIPTPTPYEPLENETLPELSGPLEFINELADDVELPFLKRSTEVLGWFAKIHDGRRAEAEAARERFNEAFRRDRPTDRNFNTDDCARFPAYCQRVADQLSFETKQRYDEYLVKMKKYNAWTDLGNITGYGWTEQEKREFLISIGRTAGGAVMEKVEDWIKTRNPHKETDPMEKIREKTEDLVKRNLEKGLEHYFPIPTPTPGATPSPTPDPAAAWEKYRQQIKELERQRKLPQRSEPDPLEEILKHVPQVPIPAPALPPVTFQPRG